MDNIYDNPFASTEIYTTPAVTDIPNVLCMYDHSGFHQFLTGEYYLLKNETIGINIVSPFNQYRHIWKYNDTTGNNRNAYLWWVPAAEGAWVITSQPPYPGITQLNGLSS